MALDFKFIKEYEDKVDSIDNMFYDFMFVSDPLEIVKLKIIKPKSDDAKKDERENVTKQITRAAMIELCSKTLRRNELVSLLCRQFHRRKVLEVIAIIEQLGMVRVLYSSGDEKEPRDEDIFAANKNFIITSTSLPQLEQMLGLIKKINQELEAIVSSILNK